MTEQEQYEYIMTDMQKKLEWLKKNTNHNVAFMIAQGSMNYNMFVYDDNYKSDIDVKCAIIPLFDDILQGKKMISRVYEMEDKSHVEVKDIRLFIELWEKSNTSYMELLFSKYQIILNENIQKIIDMKDEIAVMNLTGLYKSLKGMASEKHKALCHPYPTLIEKIEKYGYDSKQLSHCFRLYYLAYDMIINNLSYGESISLEHFGSLGKKERALILKTKIDNSYFIVDEAIEIAKSYCQNIKDLVEPEYDQHEFNKETSKKLRNIVYDIVKEECVKELTNK